MRWIRVIVSILSDVCVRCHQIFLCSVLDSLDDIFGVELMSEVVPCTNFVSDVSIESRAKVFNSPGWDMEFAIFGDCVGYVFDGCVDVGEVFYVEVCKFSVYVVRERAPVCYSYVRSPEAHILLQSRKFFFFRLS